MRSDYDKISNDYINKFDLTKKKLPDQKIEISL
jgi:hypothetical protein